MKKNNLIYIYNIKQAKFYMGKGIQCLSTDIHRTTKKTFFVFDYDSVQDAFAEWCDKNGREYLK